MTRRALLASALLLACGRKLAPRYFGWLFVASAGERGIAVADLAEFRRAATIPLNQIPGTVLLSGGRVFVTCPLAHFISVIDPGRLIITGRISLPGRVAAALVVPGTGQIAALIQQPALLLLIDSTTALVTRKIQLPQGPLNFNMNGSMAAIALADAVMRVSLSDGRVLGSTPIQSSCGAISFRADGRTILAGLPDTKEIITIDAPTGTLLVRLPMPFAPARFHMNEDGGQMFVTGRDGDAIAIVDPYQNQLDETFVGGSTPLGIAVGNSGERSLLLVTNPDSGDLTIFDTDTRLLAASVHVGGTPGEVLITPGGDYALVIGRDSGDVAVVRLSTVLDRNVRTKPLFTVFATGSEPQSAAIVPTLQL